ncbi:ribosomal protein, partial [gut metagenome]
MENNQQKLFSALSLCRRAAKLVMGFEAVAQSVYEGRVWLVLLAQDVSAGTEKRMRRVSRTDCVPCQKMPLAQIDLCPITRRKVGVYAVTDENLATLCENV